MALTIDLRVAELLCARICHDLVGPVGAIRNGVELLAEESGEFAAEAAKLIGSSSDQGAARLEFFRIAFGSAGAGSTVPAERIRDVIAGLLVGGKVDTEWLPWPDAFAAGVPRDTAKLLLNLVLIGIDCIPRGGLVTIALDGDPDGPEVGVTAAGARAAVPDEITVALSPDIAVDDLTPRSVPAYLAARLAGALGTGIEIQDQGNDAITLSAKQ